VREEFLLRKQETTIYTIYGNIYTTFGLGVPHWPATPGRPA
jgi:hypothetical protein